MGLGERRGAGRIAPAGMVLGSVASSLLSTHSFGDAQSCQGFGLGLAGQGLIQGSRNAP